VLPHATVGRANRARMTVKITRRGVIFPPSIPILTSIVLFGLVLGSTLP
jgi:hypothetical protein